MFMEPRSDSSKRGCRTGVHRIHCMRNEDEIDTQILCKFAICIHVHDPGKLQDLIWRHFPLPKEILHVGRYGARVDNPFEEPSSCFMIRIRYRKMP